MTTGASLQEPLEGVLAHGIKTVRPTAVAMLAALVVLAGAPAHADTGTTAAEVTDRPTLQAFVETAKEYLEGLTTVRGIAEMGHFFRIDGRWNAGDMFLITMTRDGDVLTHGEDPTADAKNVKAVRDESGKEVGRELLAAAERGGGFVDYRLNGEDRTAYVLPYESGLSGWPLIVVGGFALDLSSVVVEVTPLPRPAVTAAEVRDRDTLRTFVEAAARTYRDAGDDGLANVQNAFRQEGGDWKSGDVYIFVVSTDGYTLFHGGFPLRFEGRQFEDIDRQDANGVRYLRELLAAGEAGGGFVEYLFDNPAVEGDEETGSPKTAYATGFRRPGSDTVFIVASGFYETEAAPPPSAHEACPLPEGVAPPERPAVTAQQVEDGSATLKEFVLAARDSLGRVMVRDAYFYNQCLVRQEGGPYRAGSTSLVQLTPDARVLVHATDMSLAGARFDPLIYAGILSRLGVDPTVLVDLTSPDPAVAGGAFASLAETLSQRPDGSFEVPGQPGAVGHATSFYSPNAGVPIVLLAGFDVDSSHVLAEDVDYGSPSVTAADVVDRATLKAFVGEAGKYVSDRLTAGSVPALSEIRAALRDPTGPWRHGSVYTYILDPANDVITEIIATVRDAVTGKLVLPQVIAAAKSSPEGGFVEYYWDDPSDNTDSADIPKVGYAREVVARVTSSDGSVDDIRVIIGSGFYQSSDTEAAGRDRAVEAVLPQIMRAMTAGTVDAVAGRVERAASDVPQVAGLSFGGASTLPDVLRSHGQALEDGTFDLTRLLADSSFVLPLNAADDGGNGPFGNLTFWGSGDLRNISGGNRQTVGYDGDVMSANLGIDTRLRPGLLAGMSLALARGTVDYSDSGAGSGTKSGEITTSLTSINPYVGWQAPGGMNAWATAGYGTGEVETDDETADATARDLTQTMVAAGLSGQLLAGDHLIAGGDTSLTLKGETAFTRAEVEGAGALASTTLEVSRHRLMLEGAHARKLASGAFLTPSVEIGLRHDGGDGETGDGLEAGAGLSYADAASGLTVEGRARTLLSHSGDYEEWGVSGLVRLDPGASGRGLALSVQPAWGETGSGMQRLWEHGASGEAPPADRSAGRVQARVAYGIGATGGVLTPYTEVSLFGGGSRRLSLGGRFDLGPSVGMSMEGMEDRSAHGAIDHGVMLRGRLNW